LYGTTEDGGAFGYGSIFSITPLGRLTTLYSFCSGECTDGAYPTGTLIQSTDGDFYGTTWGGGATGQGTVFKINTSGVLTTLYTFCLNGLYHCTDGSGPFAGLVQATDGNFYGTTQAGGTVFKITPSGKLTTLHHLAIREGSNPFAPLVQASDGNLYGTTEQDGAYGGGTIFRITPGGTLTTIYNFCSLSNCADGYGPDAGLIQATDGNLYGTTNGRRIFSGTVFKITLGGTLTTLHNFCSLTNCADGAYPESPLVQGNDGNFYGTTAGLYIGSIFEITPDGDFTTLYDFSCSHHWGCLNGDGPDAMILHTNGKFYGTAITGGIPNSCSPTGCGTVFSLDTGLQPFVEALPTSGKVGESVKIIGTNLKGATAVMFNQIAANFTVMSSTAIRATVPVGATTGTVQVVTPSGTLASIMAFTVRP
jgi:uncharacterized repeat protein (TIGR03803 family)